MKWWPFGRRDETKYSAVGSNIVASVLGQAVWTPREYEKLAREAYVMNAIAYRCVKMIASGAAAVPWCVYNRGGEEFETHPLLDLLSRPSPVTSGAAFFEALYSYFCLAGNSYIEAVGPDRGPPKELWALRPDRMRIIAGPFGMPSAYEYTVNGIPKRWQVDPITGQGLICHIKDFHPIDDFYGMSRVEPAAFAIDQHNAAAAHNKALLDHGARPSGALVFKPVKVSPNEAQSAPPDAIKKAKEDLLSRTGPANAGKPFVFGGNVEWIEMGTTPKDMDFANVKADAAREICTAFGVPHILIIPGGATYNNIREAKLELWEDTILPILDNTLDSLNLWLTPRFANVGRIGIDLDEVPALEPRRQLRRESYAAMVTAGILDADEARAALQYGPRTDGTVKKVDPAVLKALVDSVNVVGYEPMVRYMKAVGLYSAEMTTDQILAMAVESINAMDAETVAATTTAGATAPGDMLQ